MVARSTAAVSTERTLPGRFVFSNLRPHRSARDRGMDPGGSPPRPFPIADAQVHLDANATRGVTQKAPSFKLQRNPKLQIPTVAPRMAFDVWLLELLWCLVLGIWSFRE